MDDVEKRFLAMLREEPADDETRLIYADWLEAEGHRELADFIRTDMKLAGRQVHRKKLPILRERLMKLSDASDSVWRATVSKPAIEKCTVKLSFECPLRWSALVPTQDPKVRECGVCDREVHFCATIGEVEERGRRRECVAFDSALRHREASYAYDSARDPSSEMVIEMGEYDPGSRFDR